MLILSWISAIVACLGYGTASIFQSVGARRAAEIGSGHQLSGMGRIFVQLPYLLGVGIDGLAFLANVVALQQLPLYLVQSILTASIGVTAIIAACRGADLKPRDWLALAILGLGLIFLTISAGAESAAKLSSLSEWLILASAVLPLVLGLAALRIRGRAAPALLALSSGLAFTGVAVASRGLHWNGHWMHLVVSPLVWAILVHGVIGTVAFALALQRGAVTSISAITFVVEMVVPSVIGMLILGDRVDSGLEWLAASGFLLAIVGALILARFNDG